VINERAKRYHYEKPRDRKEEKRLYGLRTRARRKYAQYGLTDEQIFLKVLGCEICGESNVVLDHDHVTGQFRGWLCNKHNWMLGNARDNPDHLIAGAEYLRRHQAGH
jgi:Recombination endonuclease VII